ncbi:uncharacterized protein K452DRAFT_301198 [Aplosporella prunicola CBS 121167]|uniref:Transcription factor domain-containing protein n=1 Tax=Aplosporella prunicola CBS 121167 TaxID=1176127 RepID=A0A6A6B4B2_9PEZI|nr:uncharacterized protein K452DRAFT_301198 [Aplosporella prunicola CBS 121167]KAF2138233.1 hypothetical protein K452DRAFT_301198 [Aplosporella prunicola CBS 121167]
MMQGREGSSIRVSRLKRPDENVRRAFPIFFMRFQLSLLMHRFCTFTQEGMFDPPQMADKMDRLFQDMRAWKSVVLEEYCPEGRIQPDMPNYHHIIYVHLEYYIALLGLSVVIGAAARLLPGQTNIRQHNSTYIRDYHNIRLIYSRRILEVIFMISDSRNHQPNVTCWLSSVTILGPFSWLYAHVMDHPAHPLARADLKLLHKACQIFHGYVTDSPRNKALEELLFTMLRAASMQVLYCVPASLTADANTPGAAFPPFSSTNIPAAAPHSFPMHTPYSPNLAGAGSAHAHPQFPPHNQPPHAFFDFSGAAAEALWAFAPGAASASPASSSAGARAVVPLPQQQQQQYLVSPGGAQQHHHQGQQQQPQQSQAQGQAQDEPAGTAYAEHPLFPDDVDLGLMMPEALGGFFGVEELGEAFFR